jgi:putative PEP-CTERM system TPR-repeat lipoprotein
MLADVQRSLKNNDAAEQALRRALSISPDAIEAQQRLIALQLEGGKRDAALKVARDVQAGQPQRAAGYLLEGEIHGTGGQWSEAANSYRKALDNGGGGQAAMRLHAALLRAERKADAERVASDWLSKNPSDLVMRGYLAERALAEKRYPDAMALFSRMHEMAPQNALILNNLAWTAKELKDPKALEYGEQALRLAPENPAIIDTVGMIQVELGDFEAGITNLKRAVALGPDLLALQLNLAKALSKAGRGAEARTQLDTLLPRLKEGTALHNEALVLQKTL